MRRGLSVVETVFSLGMVALLLFMILSLFPSAMLSVRSGERRLLAETLAASLLETQATRPFSELSPGLAQTMAPQVYEGTTFKPLLEVSRVPGTTHCRSLRLTLNWEVGGQDQEMQRELYLQDLTD